MALFDLHIHSRYSYDCKSDPELIVKVSKKKGLKGIAITDHNTVKFHEREFSEKELIIIPGIEISTKRGHILAIGTKELVPKGLEIEETIEHILEKGGLPVIPHPFDFLRHGIGKRVFKLPRTAIETHNGATIFNFMNQKAEKWAEMQSWPKVGGSDAHRVKDIGLAYTIAPDNIETVDELLDAIRKGETKGDGTHLSVIEKIIRAFQIHF